MSMSDTVRFWIFVVQLKQTFKLTTILNRESCGSKITIFGLHIPFI